MKDIEKILAPFDLSFGKKQDLGTLLAHLKKNNVSTEDVLQHIKDLKKRPKKNMPDKKDFRPCPVCESIMKLFVVNDTPDTQTGDPTDKTVWLCSNKECMHTIYNKEAIEEIIAKKE